MTDFTVMRWSTSRKHAVARRPVSGNNSPTMCASPSKPNPPFPFVLPNPKRGMDKGMGTRECLCFVFEMLFIPLILLSPFPCPTFLRIP